MPDDSPREVRPVSTPDDEAWRRMYIRQQDLDRHGYTAACPACVAIRTGNRKGGVLHLEACQTRITECLSRDLKGQPFPGGEEGRAVCGTFP